MNVKLILTRDEKVNGRKFAVYRLYAEGALMGECFTSPYSKYINYNDTRVLIRDRANWYKPTDIVFEESPSGEILGKYLGLSQEDFDHHYTFIVGNQVWTLKNMRAEEFDILRPSSWFSARIYECVAKGQKISYEMLPFPSSGATSGPYIDTIATLEANGPHLLPMLVSCFFLEMIFRPDD